MSDEHTMVESVRGPKFCCKECSLRAKGYVEWPCSTVFLRTVALLGSLTIDHIREGLKEGS